VKTAARILWDEFEETVLDQLSPFERHLAALAFWRGIVGACNVARVADADSVETLRQTMTTLRDDAAKLGDLTIACIQLRDRVP
jgi:hypothetical protein